MGDPGTRIASKAGMTPSPSPSRSAHLLPIGALGVTALFVAGLWLAGYPGWRVVAVGLLLSTMVFHAHPGSRMTVVSADRPMGPLLLSTATHVAAVALTGGLRSPLLVTTIGFSAALLGHGWSRASAGSLGLVVCSALAMALLPQAWFGPQVAEPAYSLLTGAALIAVVVLNTRLFAMMTEELNACHCEIDRSRDEMASAALARARELEQMSAHLSHELKNPLGAIKTLVQLSARDAGDDKARERLQVAEGEIERMSAILKEYLSFTRPLEKLRRESFSLGELADQVISILEPRAAGAGVALRRNGEARLEVDPRRIKEALFNLVVNALDATPRGGWVQIGIEQQGGAVRLSVRDSGRGMPQNVLERVGTPFFTTREQGTGLGVALARATFVQHGGTLEYASAEGEGTTALGTLPAPIAEGRGDGAPAPG